MLDRGTFFRSAGLPPAVLAGLAAVAVARLATLPESLWELDEMLFADGVRFFDPLSHRPHPPGFPLLIGLAKLLNLGFHDPFSSLVALSVLSSLLGYLALVSAFRSMVSGPGGTNATGGGDAAVERVAVIGSLLFHLSPALLVVGPLALSDSPSLMFLSVALAAGAKLLDRPPVGAGLWPALALGAAASAAIGCRPQLAIVVLPTLLAFLALDRNLRRASLALGAFTAVSLAWFLPLVVAVGGFQGLLGFLGKQAGLVAKYDSDEARAGWGPARLAFRFVAHAWGTRATSLPVLAAAVAGTLLLVRARSRKALPLFLLAALHFAFCLAVMEPRDGVRYSLPAQMAVALAAAVGISALASRLRRLRGAWGPAAASYGVLAVLVAAFTAYTWPLLLARSTTPSPPMQAALWAKQHLPPKSVILAEEPLLPHSAVLLPNVQRARTDKGFAMCAKTRFRPLYLLADGESRWPGAVTFRWPESDAYGKLTRDHYRVVSLSPIPTGKRYEILSGISPFEPSFRDPRWRWLGPRAQLRLHPQGGRRVTVLLGLPPQAPWASNTVALDLEGGPPREITVRRGDQAVVDLPLSDAQTVTLTLTSTASFVPAETGAGADTRRLSVQLLNLELQDS